MITLRTRIFIIASVILLLVLAVSIAFIVAGKKKAPAGESTEPTTTPQVDETNFPAELTAPSATLIPNGTAVRPLTSEDVLKNAAKQLSKIFIERYGTFSSENGGENIRECEPLVTPGLWTEIEKRIGVKPANGEFTAATSKAVAVDLAEYGDGRAKAELGVMRTVTKGTIIEEKPAHANVWMVKSGDGWLVERFEWLP